ncbi:MAG: protein translocase subunit SecD [Planctomycetota bacterium]
MVDKLNRKLTLIIGAFAVAVISLLLLEFRLGMDLKGGTRLLYSVDPEQIESAGLDSNTEVAEVIEIWRKRLDPEGVRGVKLRQEGEFGILVELPAELSLPTKRASSALAETFPKDGSTLVLASEEAAADFPKSGRIEFGGLTGGYSRVQGAKLFGFVPDKGVLSAEVAAGATVTLEASDPWRDLIENTGQMQVLMHAKDTDLQPTSNLDAEVEKAKAYFAENPTAKVGDYNTKLAEENPDTPVGRLRFFPHSRSTAESLGERLVAVIEEDTSTNPGWVFGGETFDKFYPTFGDLGQPVVGFEVINTKHNDFQTFTKEHSENKEQMAIIVNDEIVTDPTLNGALRTGGVIEGRFKADEVQNLVRALNSGALKIKPQFEDRETVGASLGEEYIRNGVISVTLGLVTVLLFMIVYYKRLGVYAAISLAFNLVLLMGAMAMLQATLTLPGIAGIILTVGMAVDANILIYERIREEALRGRRPAQSAKDGFGNALSTIVDANLTTLITAILLYNFGSGPVQGFATTLIVGILTSMFSALVFTRVLIHFALEKGVDEWKMMRAVQDTSIGFMGIAKKTMYLSAAAVIGGVVLFAFLPRNDKLSIDFVGGVSMQVSTAKPETQKSVSDALKGIEDFADVFQDAQVQPLLSSGSGDGYTNFQIEFKTDDANSTDPENDQSQKYRAAVETGLASMLSPNRVQFEEAATGMAATVFFESEQAKADVEAGLVAAGLADVAIEGAGPAASYRFTSTSEMSNNAALDRIAEVFATQRDGSGREMTLAQPIPASSTVGAQVVQQLRDDAILAILLSLFAVVMYIRVRFTEYSYGFAAVIALVHDVLVTLLFLSLAILSGMINAQISLVMIAAFLTIIGYSLNDTIVVFDRIRENLRPLEGKKSLSDIIDLSINQTLARTVLTSLTTLLTVVILFVFNVGSRNDLEGFSYAVIIGVIVGTYSSMFIASPSLLWLESRRQKRAAEERAAEEAGGSAAAS